MQVRKRGTSNAATKFHLKTQGHPKATFSKKLQGQFVDGDKFVSLNIPPPNRPNIVKNELR